MNRLKAKLIFLFCVSLPFFAAAQVQALFNDNHQPRTMTQRWELDTTAIRGTFLVTPYKPIYVLPVRWSSLPNEQPYSGNGNLDYVAPAGTNYNNIETKFQLSFKIKIFQNIFWGHGDLWVGYTQVSNWQLYNATLSRPFREINYEPEVMLNFPIKFNLFGFKTRMAGISFDHQSNGKSNPFSRSWNRIIFQFGIERGNWSVYVRPWFRLRSIKDDNPDISTYIGRGDVNVIYAIDGNVLSLVESNNLGFGSRIRGNATFSWSYPIKGNLKGFLQISHGYGETLIDYNNRQTTIGLGVSLIEWL